MTRLISCCIVASVLLLVTGCVERDVGLYPDNDAAHALGPLHMKIVGHGNLNGTATTTLPDGQVLQGRYSINAGGDGEADIMSPQGTTAHCEFLNNNFTGHGHGTCRLSHGALYRMQY